MTYRNVCYLLLFGLAASIFLFPNQLRAQSVTKITITRNPDPQPCCEQEIKDIRAVIGKDFLPDAKFIVIREFTADSEKQIYSGSCTIEKKCGKQDPKSGYKIYISERMYKSFTKEERYVVLAHEICHFVEDAPNGTIGVEKTEEERVASERAADKCSLGIIVKLEIDPSAFVSALKKTKDAYRNDKETVKLLEDRISKIKQEIKTLKKKK